MEPELIIEDLREGTGREAKSGQSVTVHYTGTLTSGKKFDSSHDHGEPFTFKLGAANAANGFFGGPLNLPAGAFRNIYFVGTAVDQAWPNQQITVTYTDGTSSVFTQSLSSWTTVGGYAGETVVASPANSLSKYGAVVKGTVHVYGYTLPIPAGKTAATIQFPQNSCVVVLGVTLY